MKRIYTIIKILLGLEPIIKGIDGVFKPPQLNIYCGKIKFYAPYFLPWGFNSSIIVIKKLQKRDLNKVYTQLRTSALPYILPMIRREKYIVIKLFNEYYYISIGIPIKLHYNELGWKSKWVSPRFEWLPTISLYFFKWQITFYWKNPVGDKYDDTYYEQIVWFLHYSNKDIEVAKETWPWFKPDTNESTWNDKYLI